MTKSEKTLSQKEKLLVLSNFFFCHNVFKKLSAAEASEIVYMRKRNKRHKLTNKWSNDWFDRVTSTLYEIYIIGVSHHFMYTVIQGFTPLPAVFRFL